MIDSAQEDDVESPSLHDVPALATEERLSIFVLVVNDVLLTIHLPSSVTDFT